MRSLFLYIHLACNVVKDRKGGGGGERGRGEREREKKRKVRNLL
jgi:hypothetical protein